MGGPDRYCAHCGAALAAEDRFCPGCGAVVGTTAPEQRRAETRAGHPVPEPEQATQPQPAARQATKRPALTKAALFGMLALAVLGGLIAGLFALAEALAPGFVYALAWSPDGRSFASAGPDQELRVWDLASAATTARTGVGSDVRALAWSPRDDLLALAVRGQVRLFRLPDLAAAGELVGSQAAPLAACFDPDGTTLYTVANDFTFDVLDIATRSRLGGLEAQAGRALAAAAFSADCQRLVTLESSDTPVITVYERVNMQTLRRIPLTWDQVPELVALNSIGSTVAGIDSGALRTWLVQSGRAGLSAKLAWLYPTALALSADNQRFAVGGRQGQVRLYDANGRLVAQVQHVGGLARLLAPLVAD